MKDSKAKTDSSKIKKTKSNKSNVAEGLKQLFVASLKDIYWAETALTKALPKMVKKATSEKLAEALEMHLGETEEQIARLKEVFALIGEKAVAKKCDAMAGLIEEAKSIMDETAKGAVRDAGIISAAQKIEHYEIATYGTLVAFAKTLDEDEVAEILAITLAEEKQADQTLSEAAYNSINFKAAKEDLDQENVTK